jgi:hypothetical protein
LTLNVTLRSSTAISLRIGYTASAPIHASFSTILRRFSKEYPEIRLELLHASTGEQVEMLTAPVEPAADGRRRAAGPVAHPKNPDRHQRAFDARDRGSLGDEHWTLTKIIDRMVSEALVYRIPDPEDRRKVRLAVSDKGRSLFARQNALVSDHQNQG